MDRPLGACDRISEMEEATNDTLEDWFMGKKTSTFEHGLSSRRRRLPSPPRDQHVDESGTEYARQFQEEESATCAQISQTVELFEKCRIQGPTMSLLEEDSTVFSELLNPTDAEMLKGKTSVYKEYDFTMPVFPQLAIFEIREKLLDLLKTESAVVVKGFTGCGKTTQVPQFILDSCASKQIPCNIVVTQPRRIGAVSIAKRVSQERNWQVGTVVGYQVGMERKVGPFTCLTYMTTGCLLETLVSKKALDGFTHIIVDEVHERDEDTDLLLLVLRKFLKHTNSTKVILMSATVEASKFSEYFSTPMNSFLKPAPIIEVGSEQKFAVHTYYWDEIETIPFLTRFSPSFNPAEPCINEETYRATAILIASFDEKREIVRFGHQHEASHLSSCRGAVLVFLPGLNEIETMHRHLEILEEGTDRKNLWLILPLHSRVTSQEQSRVFQSPPSGYRKIILATNIAESSITVPDIIYVFDFCLVKQLVADPSTNFCSLKVEWAPKNNCVQRKGRVGRVNEGVVYRMVPQQFYETYLPDNVTPEILRCPLEQTILRTKLLDLGEPKALLALAVDPPKLDNICKTISTLKEVGALFLTANGKLTPHDGDLSYLGRVIARLPLDVHLGKLIMLGYFFNILDECVIMAAGLGSKNIFTSPYQENLRSYQVKMAWAEGSFSDPITILNAFKVWKQLVHSDYFHRSGQNEREREMQWAVKQCVQLKALKEMDCLVSEIHDRLKAMGIEPLTGPNSRPLLHWQKALLRRVVLFGAFYPQFFYREAINGQIDEREAVKSLCGLDPFTTIRLGGFPSNQPGKAYVRQIKDCLKEIFKILQEDTWNAKISFDCSRVFIHFHQEGNPSQCKKIPGRIALPVYLALKQKQLQNRHANPEAHFYRIQLMDAKDAAKYSRQVEVAAQRLLRDDDDESLVSSSSRCNSQLRFFVEIPSSRLPDVTEEYLKVTICHTEEPDHFWIHRLDEKSVLDYKAVSKIIQRSCSDQERALDYPVRKGCLVLGPYGDSGSPPDYYRAKVLSVQQAVVDSVRRVKLYFIDFGNATEVFMSELRNIPEELLNIPPLALECRLAGVGPSPIHDAKGKWTADAIDWFKKETEEKILTGKIYSVVNGILSLDLCNEVEFDSKKSVASDIVRLKYGVQVVEPYCSQLDREERERARGSSAVQIDMLRKIDSRTSAAELVAIEHDVPYHQGSRHQTITLSGPTNPLEMRMYGKVAALSSRYLRIDGDSVNSILLDDQPGDRHERVLVAAMVGIHPVDNRVTARQTTLLPAIHGLPALLTLLFAPRAEMRTNPARTALTGALCGLGFDKKTNRSLYPEHDMEIVFDTEITVMDILLINKIRYWMNSIFGAQSFAESQISPTTEKMRDVSSKSLQHLFELLPIQRKDVELFYCPTPYKWNLIDSAHLLASESTENHLSNLIPLHDCIHIMP